LRNARADRELEERRKFREEQSRKGKLSAQKRWGTPNQKITTVTSRLRNDLTEIQPDGNLPSPSKLKIPSSESSDSDSPISPGNGKDHGRAQAFFDLWNQEAKTLPKATKLTEARRRKILARLRERPLDEWRQVFRRMERSSFLRGESGGSFRADLDWIIANEGNTFKVIEGRYDDREKRPAASTIRDATGKIL